MGTQFHESRPAEKLIVRWQDEQGRIQAKGFAFTLSAWAFAADHRGVVVPAMRVSDRAVRQ
jgi:hypothetical protein